MKSILLFLLLFSFNLSAGIYHIRVMNNSFIPSSLVLVCGDQVIWTLKEGDHTTTSVSIPAGADPWDYHFTGPGDTFTYNVNISGHYSYKCNLYPGMTDTFLASCSFPLMENFSYPAGDSISLYGWNITGNVFTNPVMTVSPGLYYPGYFLSGIGNAAALCNTGADINKEFPHPINSGSLYVSAMVKVSNARSGDYFLHLGVSAVNTTAFYARVFIKQSSSQMFSFGISKSATGSTILPVYTEPVFMKDTTYLLVLKYIFKPEVNDDTVCLFINPPLNEHEPAPDLVHGISSGNDPVVLKTINLRQGSSSSAADLHIDGLKAALNWLDIVPVELISFTARSAGDNIIIEWLTGSELNNRGFEIERRQSGVWQTIGFVSGNGTSDRHCYSFTDKNLPAGKYSYRLLQRDYNGASQYSFAVEAEVSADSDHILSIYPNPFNSSAVVKYTVTEAGNIKIILYNLLGEQITVLTEAYKEAGTYSFLMYNTGLYSGVYFCKYISDNKTVTQKIILVK